MFANISRERASVGEQDIMAYFDRLKLTLEGVPASDILNYDEPNFSDNPGTKKMLFKRGCKYPERIMDANEGKHISNVFGRWGR